MSDGKLFVSLIGAVVLIVVALLFLFPVYGRYQARANAKNHVKVNATRIRFFQQQEGIERKKADIRVIHAVGIRKAQDEIQATLTPLYVQFEMVQALRDIAASGRNNSVVFVPTTNTGGLPIIPGITEKAGK